MKKLKKIHKVIFILGFGFSVVLGAASYSGYHSLFSRTFSEPSTSLRRAPDFELQDILGHKYRLKDLSGNVVIVHFWASWCSPCLEEIPHWVELGTAFQGRPIRLVAVSLDQSWEDARKVLPTEKLTPHVISLLDTSNQVPDRFGSYQFPETYLLNSKLEILSKWVGPQDWSSPKIRGAIESSLADLDSR